MNRFVQIVFSSILLVGICTNIIPAQNTRTIILEEFTGAWCGYCPYGADSLDAVLNTYYNARGISYHHQDLSNGWVDTLKTAEGETFISNIGNTSYPMAAIDRVLWSGQSVIPIIRSLWRSKTDIRNNLESPMSITVGGTFHTPSRLMTAQVHIEALANVTGSYNLNLILTEDNINYKQYFYPQNGPNYWIDPYYHKHVVRKMITGATGKLFTTSGFQNGGSRDTTIYFVIPSWWNYNNLSLSVFLSQTNTSGQPVLQGFQEKTSSIFSNTPVRLMSFFAEQKDQDVQLSWRTATESNNYGWEIERTDDSKQWSKIGFVSGHGTTNEQMCYEFRDNNLNQNTHYMYRLKQVDVDGTLEYSPVAHVYTFVTPTTYNVEQNYPNPFGAATLTGNPNTTISYSLPVAEQVSIKVFDNLGRLVKTLFDDVQQSGPWSVDWNGINEAGVQVANGLYYYTVTTPHYSTTKRMMLLK